MPKYCGGGRWTEDEVFILKEFQEASGAKAEFTTSKADGDTPVYYFTDVVKPDTLRAGVITQIRVKLNWANAVTLEALRFHEKAVAGDYESNSNKIFDSDEYVASLNDDEEYVFDVEIPFHLDIAGRMYLGLQWSAACGNIQGEITVKGRVVQ